MGRGGIFANGVGNVLVKDIYFIFRLGGPYSEKL